MRSNSARLFRANGHDAALDADVERVVVTSVHVQDIADAHIEAMTAETAGANRTIVATDPSSLIDVAAVLREPLQPVVPIGDPVSPGALSCCPSRTGQRAP